MTFCLPADYSSVQRERRTTRGTEATRAVGFCQVGTGLGFFASHRSLHQRSPARLRPFTRPSRLAASFLNARRG